jgi:hypothetical protein
VVEAEAGLSSGWKKGVKRLPWRIRPVAVIFKKYRDPFNMSLFHNPNLRGRFGTRIRAWALPKSDILPSSRAQQNRLRADIEKLVRLGNFTKDICRYMAFVKSSCGRVAQGILRERP